MSDTSEQFDEISPSELPAATSINDGDLLIVDQGVTAPRTGITRSATALQLRNYVGSLASFPSPPPLGNENPNSGAFTSLTATQVLAQGAPTARSLASRFADQASVLDYGCIGDGVTDDTVAFQLAVNDCAGVRTLLVPAGLTVLLDNVISLPSGTNLVIGGTINLASRTTACVNMLLINGSNVSVTGRGIIDGNASGQTGSKLTPSCGITTNLLENPPVPGSLFSNVYVAGITIRNFVNQPINLIFCQDSLCENCIFHDSGNSPEIIQSVNTHFYKCTSYNINDDGLGIYGGNSMCSVSECTVYDCATGPFILADTAQPLLNTNCSLINNRAWNNTNAGIFVGSPTGTQQSGILVSGNQLSANGVGLLGNIDIVNIANAIICDNACSTPSTGIAQQTCLSITGLLTNVKIKNNILQGYQSNILFLHEDNTANANVLIEDNLIYDFSAPGSAAGLALQTVGSSAYITCRNNVLAGKISVPYVDGNGNATFEGYKTVGNTTNQRIFSEQIFSPSFMVDNTSGPTITGGSGAPTAVLPASSLYLRADGGVGIHLYVSQGGGTWLPLAGV